MDTNRSSVTAKLLTSHGLDVIKSALFHTHVAHFNINLYRQVVVSLHLDYITLNHNVLHESLGTRETLTVFE